MKHKKNLGPDKLKEAEKIQKGGFFYKFRMFDADDQHPTINTNNLKIPTIGNRLILKL